MLSGQDPSQPSDVSKFALKLAKRRKKGKDIRQRDVDALLEMVGEYMSHQSISGRDRVSFARNVLTKIVPAITATDLDTLSQKEVSNIEVTKEFRKSVRKMIENEI